MNRTRLARRLCLLACSAAVVPLAGCGGDEESNEPEVDPEEVEFPTAAPEEADSSVAFLEGEGAPLIVVHEVARSLPENPGAAECRAAGAKLDAQVRSDDALRLALGIEDEPLRTAFTAERSTLGALLAACVAADDPAELSDLSADLTVAQELVEKRLAEVRAGG